MTCAPLIDALAKALGCKTQAELAKKLGLSQGRLSNYRHGKVEPKAGRLLGWVRVLNDATGEAHGLDCEGRPVLLV